MNEYYDKHGYSFNHVSSNWMNISNNIRKKIFEQNIEDYKPKKFKPPNIELKPHKKHQFTNTFDQLNYKEKII